MEYVEMLLSKHAIRDKGPNNYRLNSHERFIMKQSEP